MLCFFLFFFYRASVDKIMMGSILATADQSRTSEARMRVKRRLQAAFLKPIARNGLIYYEKVRQEQILANFNLTAHFARLHGD